MLDLLTKAFFAARFVIIAICLIAMVAYIIYRIIVND